MQEQNSSCSRGENGKIRIISSCSGFGSNVGQFANAPACQRIREGYGSGSYLYDVSGGIEKKGIADEQYREIE